MLIYSKGRNFVGLSCNCNASSNAAIRVCVYSLKKAEGAVWWQLQFSLLGSQVTNEQSVTSHHILQKDKPHILGKTREYELHYTAIQSW